MPPTKKTPAAAPKKKKPSSPSARLSPARLQELIEEATVDCYDDAECLTGFHAMLENDLKVPFDTEVLGVAVTVKRIELTKDERIVAICTRQGKQQAIALQDLPLPSPPPAGAQWIAAYRAWNEQSVGSDQLMDDEEMDEDLDD